LPAEAVITRGISVRQSGWTSSRSAAQLKAVYRLAIFTLHQNNVIQPRRAYPFFAAAFSAPLHKPARAALLEVLGALRGAGQGL
jgi:hypothetical protein